MPVLLSGEQKRELGELRLLVGAQAKAYTDQELLRTLKFVGDLDLTVCAWLMSPRPPWVHNVATNRRV